MILQPPPPSQKRSAALGLFAVAWRESGGLRGRVQPQAQARTRRGFREPVKALVGDREERTPQAAGQCDLVERVFDHREYVDDVENLLLRIER